MLRSDGGWRALLLLARVVDPQGGTHPPTGTDAHPHARTTFPRRSVMIWPKSGEYQKISVTCRLTICARP